MACGTKRGSCNCKRSCGGKEGGCGCDSCMGWLESERGGGSSRTSRLQVGRPVLNVGGRDRIEGRTALSQGAGKRWLAPVILSGSVSPGAGLVAAKTRAGLHHKTRALEDLVHWGADGLAQTPISGIGCAALARARNHTTQRFSGQAVGSIAGDPHEVSGRLRMSTSRQCFKSVLSRSGRLVSQKPGHLASPDGVTEDRVAGGGGASRRLGVTGNSYRECVRECYDEHLTCLLACIPLYHPDMRKLVQGLSPQACFVFCALVMTACLARCELRRTLAPYPGRDECERHRVTAFGTCPGLGGCRRGEHCRAPLYLSKNRDPYFCTDPSRPCRLRVLPGDSCTCSESPEPPAPACGPCL